MLINFNLLNQKERKGYTFGFGKILEFGFNSTTIILQDADTENLEDTSPQQNSGTNWGLNTELYNFYNGTFIWSNILKFDISSVPSTAQINEVNLSLFVTSNGVDAGEYWNITSHHFDNQTWHLYGQMIPLEI